MTPRRTRDNDSILKLALIGTGAISPRYLRQAARSSRARIVATCARTLESAKARAEEYGIESWFDDYRTMYDEVAPDGVIIASPSSTHAAQAISALEKGIHVLCEKPMATTWTDCQAMVAAARQAGAVLLCLPYESYPGPLRALDFLNEETLGAFTGAEANLLLPGHPFDDWFYDREIAGGVTLDTLVYPVSRLTNLLGPARRVTGLINTLIPHRLVNGKTVESNIDDNVTLIVEWPSGQQATLRALWGTASLRSDTVIYARSGTLWLSGFAGNELVVQSPKVAIPEATPVKWGSHPDCFQVPVRKVEEDLEEDLVEHFIDCIKGAAPTTCRPEQQLHVHEILFKGYQASRTGRVQELETTFEPWHTVDPKFMDTRSRPV